MKRNKKENHLANKKLNSTEVKNLVEKHRPKTIDEDEIKVDQLKDQIKKSFDEVEEEIKKQESTSKKKSSKKRKTRKSKSKKKHGWIGKTLITIALIIISLIVVQLTISSDNVIESSMDQL